MGPGIKSSQPGVAHMRRSLRALVFTAVVGSLALTGCGSADGTPSSADASQPATSAAARAYAEGLAKVAPDAVESAEEAVARDPRFAPAYILLAEGSYFRQGPPCGDSSPPECGRNRDTSHQRGCRAR